MLNLSNLKDEPVHIDPTMIRGFWSNHKGGTVLLVHSSLIKLFHPVSEVAQSPTLIRDMLEGAMPAKSAK